jgi:hypothetical protein
MSFSVDEVWLFAKFKADLSLSAVSHYALSTVVFISKTVGHALNQLDL